MWVNIWLNLSLFLNEKLELYEENNDEATPKRKEFSKDPVKKSHFSTLPSVQISKNGFSEQLNPPKELKRLTLLTENGKSLKMPFKIPTQKEI